MLQESATMMVEYDSFQTYVQSLPRLRLFYPVWIAMMCLVMIGGVFFNVRLILFIIRRKRLQESPTYITLLSLAVSDVFVLVSVPVFIYFMYTGGVYKAFCMVYLFLTFTAMMTSTYHLVAFAILRFVILTKPFFATRHVTTRCAVTTCIVVWILSLTMATSSFFFTDLVRFNTSTNSSTSVCAVSFNDGGYAVTLLITMTAMPIVLMLLFHLLKMLYMKTKGPQAVSGSNRRQVSASVIFGILVLFIVCTLPVGVGWNYVLLNRKSTLQLVISAYFICTLTYINSALNPLVYFFSDKISMRKCFVRVNGQGEKGTVQSTIDLDGLSQGATRQADVNRKAVNSVSGSNLYTVDGNGITLNADNVTSYISCGDTSARNDQSVSGNIDDKKYIATI